MRRIKGVSLVVSGTEQKNRTSPLFPWMSLEETKGSAAHPQEIICNQTAMGVPPVASALFLIAKLSEIPLLPLRG
jgi:hypothetical protein